MLIFARTTVTKSVEVPDPLAVEDLISSNLNNKRELTRLIMQYRDIFLPFEIPFLLMDDDVIHEGRRQSNGTHSLTRF